MKVELIPKLPLGPDLRPRCEALVNEQTADHRRRRAVHQDHSSYTIACCRRASIRIGTLCYCGLHGQAEVLRIALKQGHV